MLKHWQKQTTTPETEKPLGRRFPNLVAQFMCGIVRSISAGFKHRRPFPQRTNLPALMVASCFGAMHCLTPLGRAFSYQTMKMQKGQKLTEEQKQQRREARKLNAAKWREEREERAHWINAEVLTLRAEIYHLREVAAAFTFTPEEKAVLLEFSGSKVVDEHAIRVAAMWAMRFAICHPNQYQAWASWLTRYHKAEGINCAEYVKLKINASLPTIQHS